MFEPGIIFFIIQALIWLALMGNMLQRIDQAPGFPARSYLDHMARSSSS